MRDSETFGIESGFGSKVVDWMNEQAKKHKWKFEARQYDYEIKTQNFGTFEMFSWIGDAKVARNQIKKASKRFKIKIIEGGFRPKEKIIKLKKSDYAIVRRGDRIIGRLEFSASILGSKWKLEGEERT